MRDLADETCTVRLPRGTKAKLVAATGQPFSRLMRFIAIELLAKYQSQGPIVDARRELHADVRATVQQSELPND